MKHFVVPMRFWINEVLDQRGFGGFGSTRFWWFWINEVLVVLDQRGFGFGSTRFWINEVLD